MFKPLCCYSDSGFFSILILFLSSLFLSFHHHSITGANLLPSHPDFNLCQQHLDSKSRLRLVGRFADSWLGQWLWHCHLPEALVEGQLQWWGGGWAGGTIPSLPHWIYSRSAGPCQWIPVGMWVQSSELGTLSACIYLSRVVSNPDSKPLPGIPDFSYSLNSSAIDEIPPLWTFPGLFVHNLLFSHPK